MSRMTRQVLCAVLVVLLALSPAVALAEEGGAPPSCHPSHDESCGYTQAAPCGHDHSDACGYTQDETGQELTPCTHSHDPDCGYAEAAPCTHSCAVCAPEPEPGPEPDETLITGFLELPEEVRTRRTAMRVSRDKLGLPTELEATAGGETVRVPVEHWLASPYYNMLQAGSYTFTAVVSPEWALAEGVLPPVITVEVMPIGPRTAQGAGTKRNPLVVDSGWSLHELALAWNAGELQYNTSGLGDPDEGGKLYIKLAKSIDVSDIGGTQGWVPFGNATRPFSGDFDGGGHTITGLRINRPGSGYQGLFGEVKDGVIKSLCAEGAVSGGGDNIGGVAGYVDNSTLQDCGFSGTVSGRYNIGGAAGFVQNSTLQSCGVSGAVSGDSGIGGIAGRAESVTITSCWNSGAVSVSAVVGGGAGGIAGYAQSATITSCWNSGAVSSLGPSSRCGGIAGHLVSATIAACWNSGEVYAQLSGTLSGGIAGNITDSARIEACVSLGPGVFSPAKGFVAGKSTDSSVVRDNLWWGGDDRPLRGGRQHRQRKQRQRRRHRNHRQLYRRRLSEHLAGRLSCRPLGVCGAGGLPADTEGHAGAGWHPAIVVCRCKRSGDHQRDTAARLCGGGQRRE